jgi:hypothetical protein
MGSLTGKAKSQRLSVRLTSAPVMLAQERPPEVAIKVLPDHISSNPELRERFSRVSRAR